MKGRFFLFLFLATIFSAQTEDKIIHKLQVPPVHIPETAPKLPPLVQTSNHVSISTKKQWLKQREVLKTKWQKFLGEFPKQRAPLKTEIVSTEALPGFTRDYVRYQIEDGVWEDGYLLTPKAKAQHTKFPAIVVFHPTTPLQAKGVAGLAPDYAEEKWQGVQLVQRGYVVWCPRNFIFDENSDAADGAKLWTANAAKLQTSHPHWHSMTRMTFDAIRAADFLESLPNVD